ncbi:MAG: methyl-accepting chemotaxis protein [Cardiobacteriaceae bacterium]|nr:methyl-accepting chemotaxis protein [Cardiobacteriaceae bacterium]
MLSSKNRVSDRANNKSAFFMPAMAISGVAGGLSLISLFQLYFSGGSLLTIILPITLISVAIAAFFWYQVVGQQYSKIQHVSSEAEFRVKRDQDAIVRLMSELSDFSNGDLTVEAQVTEDFTGAIADAVNYAIESMRELVGTINRTSSQVSNASNSTRVIAEQMQSSSIEQAQKIHSIAKIIGDMVRSLDRVAMSTNDSAEIAHNSVSIAREGAQQVRNTINGMNNIRGNIQETRTLIKRLGESSQEIGNIVEIIKSIADQTNILALNAAIQANSAGEAGRGFAVVADEVQRLAERSSNATKRIEGLVKTIQNDTNAAVSSMERSTKEVVDGANIAEEAGTALSKIEDVSTSLASLIERVSESTRKVSTMAENIASDMAQINQMTVTTTENVIKTSDSIENLSLLSQELKNSVSGFKLPVGY